MKAKEIERARKRFFCETSMNFSSCEREVPKMMELLRRVYNAVEMDHLASNKWSSKTYKVDISRSLCDDIFNYLQVKDQKFRDTTIRRQKNFRKRQKNKFKATLKHHVNNYIKQNNLND